MRLRPRFFGGRYRVLEPDEGKLSWRPVMASGYSAKRFEEHRGNRKFCHLNPFEFFDHSVLQKHTDKEFIMN
jgi:hypothetical protein